jgi:hypothetical protein
MDRGVGAGGPAQGQAGDLRLELKYAPSVADRVREMVRDEQQCCSFLNCDLSEIDEGVRLTITAPERAREIADALFD